MKYHTCGFPIGKKYRSHFEIIALMVEALKNGDQAKFSIMRHANINSGQFNKFLNSLIRIGFVEPYVADRRPVYRASIKGQQFLRQYYVLLSMLMSSENGAKRLSVTCEPELRHK
jgi:predicted transcriptional regulator